MDYWWNMLMPNGGFDFLLMFAFAAVKASVLLSFVALICLFFRRLSAGARHLLWTVALCAALVFPLLSFLNLWEVPILPAGLSPGMRVANQSIENNEAVGEPETTLIAAAESLISVEAEDRRAALKNYELTAKTESREAFLSTSGDSPRRQAPPAKNQAALLLPASINWICTIWIAGVFLFSIRLLVGLAAGKFLVRRGSEFEDEALNELFSAVCAELKLKNKPRLLSSAHTVMPVVCGVFRSVVLLPAGAAEWSAERQRMVLLHELAHVARRDCLTQVLALVACAFYWFNPLVWFAARRLRVEREQACDDRVLSVGTKPSDYAYHLLEIARTVQEAERSAFEWSPKISVAMARPSKLECRLRAVLSEENHTGALPRAATVGLTGLLCLVLFSLAILRPTVINAQKSPNDKTDMAEKSVADSSVDSGQRFGVSISEPEINKEITGQAASEPFEDLAEQNLDNEPNDKADAPAMTPAAPILSEVVSANVNEQIAATLQTPQTAPLTAPEPDIYVNAEYRQERRTQTEPEDFIDEMASVGYTNLSVNDLIRLKQANVTAEYVRNLAALGYTDLPVRELASMGIHGVTPAYIQTIRAAGYNLTAKEMASFRIHNVTPEFINSLRAAGYDGLSARQLTNFAVHQVTPAFIKAIRTVGYANLSPRDLVALRVYEITPEFIRQARGSYGELTVRQLIALKNKGTLDAEKVKEKEEDNE